MHPNVAKIYIVAGTTIALVWILYLLNILQLGILGFYLLILFTILFIISIFSKPPRSDSQSRRDTDGNIFPFG